MLKTREEIHAWLIDMEIGRFTIQEDLTVDVRGSVNLSNRMLTEIPVQFGEVVGNFDCSNNKLTHLQGSPHTSKLSFLCINNFLTTLEGAPERIYGEFDASSNPLVSTKGIPSYINNICFLNNTHLKELNDLPDHLLHGLVICNSNGYIEDFRDFYKPTYLDGVPNYEEAILSLKTIQSINLHKKLQKNIDINKFIKPLRGKI